jgi:hypothetical protein
MFSKVNAGRYALGTHVDGLPMVRFIPVFEERLKTAQTSVAEITLQPLVHPGEYHLIQAHFLVPRHWPASIHLQKEK